MYNFLDESDYREAQSEKIASLEAENAALRLQQEEWKEAHGELAAQLTCANNLVQKLVEAGEKLAELPKQMLDFHNEIIGQSEVEDYLTAWQAALEDN